MNVEKICVYLLYLSLVIPFVLISICCVLCCFPTHYILVLLLSYLDFLWVFASCSFALSCTHFVCWIFLSLIKAHLLFDFSHFCLDFSLLLESIDRIKD